MTRRRLGLLAAVFVVVALGAAAALGNDDASEPEGVASEAGRYRVVLESDPESSPVNRLHAWRFQLLDRDGAPVDGARFEVDGDMPAHGHGLPTRPLVRELGGGDYVIDGMKFQMGGRWYVQLRIDADGGSDTLRLDFDLAP